MDKPSTSIQRESQLYVAEGISGDPLFDQAMRIRALRAEGRFPDTAVRRLEDDHDARRHGPTDVEKAHARYREAHDSVLRKVRSGETSLDREYVKLHDAAIDLRAAGQFPREPIPSKEEFGELAFWARYWNRVHKGASISMNALRTTRERIPLEQDWSSVRAWLERWLAERSGQELRSGCEATGTFEGGFVAPRQYTDGSKPLPSGWSNWFDATNSHDKWWTSTSLSVTHDPYPAWIYGYLWFYVDIPVPEAGPFTLQLRSEAHMYPSDVDHWQIGARGWTLFHFHDLWVQHTAPDGRVTQLGPTPYEERRVASFRQQFDVEGTTSAEQYHEDLLMGVDPVCPDQDPEWPRICDSQTVIEREYAFTGPCTLRVAEQPTYFMNVLRSNAFFRNGYAHSGPMSGFLAPLCWSLRYA